MQSFQENVAKLDSGDTQVLGVSMDRLCLAKTSYTAK
jgi:peroxiredoxin